MKAIAYLDCFSNRKHNGLLEISLEQLNSKTLEKPADQFGKWICALNYHLNDWDLIRFSLLFKLLTENVFYLRLTFEIIVILSTIYCLQSSVYNVPAENLVLVNTWSVSWKQIVLQWTFKVLNESTYKCWLISRVLKNCLYESRIKYIYSLFTIEIRTFIEFNES